MDKLMWKDDLRKEKLNNSNNYIYLEGVVVSELETSHELYGEKFLTFTLEVDRLSDVKDELNITVSERLLINKEELSLGDFICVEGQLRSYNKVTSDGRNKLVLTVFTRELNKIEEKTKSPNSITLEGYICKEPIYRKTPFGREIADVLIAVNRAYNKSDYVPAIAWGRNARFSSSLEVGEKIKIWGRVQSRAYEKKIDEETIEVRMAYEVSISKMQKIDGSMELENKENQSDAI